MSSSLVSLDRGDVKITPLTDFDAEYDGTLIDLWKALQQTSVDAVQSPATSVWTWAESCVLLAQVKRLISPTSSSSQNDEDDINTLYDGPTSRRLLDQPWGTFDKSWRAPTDLPSTPHGPDSDSNTSDLAYINTDFINRVDQLPEDARDLGALCLYTPLLLRRDGTVTLYHAYFYERILLLVIDTEGSWLPVSIVTPRSSPLHVVGVIHLQDISQVGHVFVHLDGFGAYGIALAVLMTDNIPHDFTLVISSPDTLASWSNALLARTSRNVSRAGAQSASIVKGLVALTDWPSISAPLQHYGPLLQYSTVLIMSNAETVRSGAYLFQEHLVLISKIRDGEFKVLRDIPLTEIVDIYVQESATTLFVQGEYPAPWWAKLFLSSKDYRFWTVLKARVDALYPQSRLASSHTKSQAGVFGVPAWQQAGMVSLSPSIDSGSEYNIAVAILPDHRGHGLATQAIAFALQFAFDTLGAHRVQARVLHGAGSIDAQDAACRFIHWGFTHEGTRRRVVANPSNGNWFDVSILSMLDMDWALRETKRPPMQTPWDELFARHQREREALRAAQGSTTIRAPHNTYLDIGLTDSVMDNLESSETMSSVPGSHYAPSLGTLQTSDAGTGGGTSWSSWAAVPDAPEDAQPVSEQIRRWIAQQMVARGDQDFDSSREEHRNDEGATSNRSDD